jgi:uncharacterized protein
MKLMILSDTHGNYLLAVKALEEAGQVDQIIHLGDEFEDARMIEAISGSPLIKVPGNCDLGVEDARNITVTFDGIRVFMTHGDRYQVKSGLARLHKKAAAEQAGIVLYGHTHVAAITEIDGILFVNPGCLGYNCSTPSYAILTITHGKVAAEICPITP